jgi:hypothetical protein
MFDRARPRHLSFLAAVILAFHLSGCSPSNLFHGRLFVINSSGGVLRSPAITNSHPGLKQSFEFPDMADGQAWVRDCGGDNPIVVLGDLTLSYLDRTGTTRSRSVPFEGEIPDYCHDDFFIEIDQNGQLHWGLLIRQNYRENYYTVVKTHAIAAAIGLLLGWMLWRGRRVRTARLDQPEKTVTPEL